MNRTYDDWKADAPQGEEPSTSCGPRCTGCPDCSVTLDPCPPALPTDANPDVFFGPLLGTWAFTARIMAEGDDSGFDWDRWKDEMKEHDWDE